MLQSVDDICLVEVVDSAAPPQLQVAHELEDCGPLVGQIVSQPQTSQDRQEIIDLQVVGSVSRAVRWSGGEVVSYLLDILVRVEDEHLPGVAHQLALRGVEGGEGAGVAAEGQTAGLAPDYAGVEEGAAAGHTAHGRHLPGTPGHRPLLHHDVPDLHLPGGHQGPPPPLPHLHTDPSLSCREHTGPLDHYLIILPFNTFCANCACSFILLASLHTGSTNIADLADLTRQANIIFHLMGI